MLDSGAEIHVMGTSYLIATKEILHSNINNSHQDIKDMINNKLQQQELTETDPNNYKK